MIPAPLRVATLAAGCLLNPLSAQAISFDFLDGKLQGVLNTAVTVGGAWRMQDRASELIGKANLDPGVCAAVYQSCQGLFLEQIYPAQQLARSPGALNMRSDDGNLNYDKGDWVQGLFKSTQDLTLNYGSFGLFARWLYFYDAVNNDFDERLPNLITAENAAHTGTTGDPVANRYFQRVYGAGATTVRERGNSDTLDQVGTDLQVLDLNFFGQLPLGGERTLRFKVGRQTLNWGESTLLVVNSLNSINPVNVNNFFRVGFTVEEVFTPLGMVTLSTEPFYNATVEAFWQYEWEPFEIPPPGSYFSFIDLGTPNINDFVNLSFGGSADDPDRVGFLLDNPLALITPTTGRIGRAADGEPPDAGQFGVSFKYYAENLNNGTEFGLYYHRLHSRLPFVSFFATDASCARREGNSMGLDVRTPLDFINACPDVPGLAIAQARQQFLNDAGPVVAANPQDLGTDPLSGLLALQTLAARTDNADPTNRAAFDDAVPLDTGRIRLEYPEDIETFGLSFNTTFGDLAFQGELAYRPRQPLQVAVMDLAFAAAGPTLTRCHDPALDCVGSSGGSGFTESGGRTAYGGSDVRDVNPAFAYDDTVNLFLGHVPGSARAFPNFITSYRGGTVGETAPNSYIRGWETFDVFQYNLGTTRIYGATENPFGADQIILVGELGAVHIPGLPDLDVLQIEGPGIYTHASAGADGTGADGSQQACAQNPTCVTGPDGGRFNPTQAPLHAFVDSFSMGYRVIAIVRYESVLPGISVQPFIVLAHDVKGTSPGPAENFVEGRRNALLNVEVRYKSALSFTLGYTWFTGAGAQNLYRDRDFAQAFMRYQF